jgi:nucleotidyltransferase/DNA polymerase involved in DNA repair
MPQTHNPAPSLQTKPKVRGSRSLACAWVADLPSWAVKRLEPALRGLTVIVLEGRRVVGVCALARKAGVRVGDALDRARVLCPEAAIAQLEPSALGAAWDAALETMHRVTPWIESVRPGMAYLAGITALDGEALASDLDLRVGVSDTRAAALLAALAARERGARLIQDETAFVSRVPVRFLRGAGIEAEIVERLELFGLKTIGDILLRVTPRQLEAQFGKAATPLWDLISGSDTRPVGLYTPPTSIQVFYACDPPMLEPFEWQPILEHLVARAVEQLQTHLTGTLTVTLQTVLGESSARQVMKQYSRDAKTLLNSAIKCLTEIHAGLEFERITLMFSDLLRPIPHQDNLFNIVERPNVREAISSVHQHYPDKIGKLEIVRPNGPLREKRFRFAPLDGTQPRVKRKSPEPNLVKPKRSRKKP